MLYLLWIQILNLYSNKIILAAPGQNQQSDCASCEDSDQPGHPPSLIRVFARRSLSSFFMRTADTLIRLGGCPGSSESSLGLQVNFCQFLLQKLHLSYDIASERGIKPCIKNGKPLVDYICKLLHNVTRLR